MVREVAREVPRERIDDPIEGTRRRRAEPTVTATVVIIATAIVFIAVSNDVGIIVM
jgi:hypothetical protein